MVLKYTINSMNQNSNKINNDLLEYTNGGEREHRFDSSYIIIIYTRRVCFEFSEKTTGC